MKKLLLLAGLTLALFTSCGGDNSGKTLSGLNPKDFEITKDGVKTELYVLKNANGMEVCFTNVGARIVSIMVPDKNGDLKDVVLGFDSIGKYLRIPSDFGACIGRYANRLDHGQITVDGKTIQLPINNCGHTLHGGPKGWQYKIFDATKIDCQTLEFSVTSPDGEMNFPGTVNARVTYTLTDDNAIDIQYDATTDKQTVINMTNHSYFNLNGDPSEPITNHILYVNANKYTPIDKTFMTTGDIASVLYTPLDFNKPTAIGERINVDDQQLKNGLGYDHNYVLNTGGSEDKLAASVKSPETGIVLKVYTDQPGIQIYTGNSLDGSVTGKDGVVYKKHDAVCLETQIFPDSPNKSIKGLKGWPSGYLNPGDTYHHHTIFKFSVEK